MLRILFITQELDDDHDILGITPVWIRELSRLVEHIHVLALSVGNVSLPTNTTIYSMGKKYGSRSNLSWLQKICVLGRYIKIVDRLLANQKVDVVFSHMIPLYAILSVLLARPRKIPSVLWYAHKSADLRLRMAHFLVDAVLTPTYESFHLPSAKLWVTGHGIPFDHFECNDRDYKSHVIISVGRISRIKHHETLIKAGEILIDHYGHKDISIYIVGGPALEEDKYYAEELEKQIRCTSVAGKVVMTGNVPYNKVFEFYKRATVFVSDSATGSLDKTFIEAIASGIPPVVSDNVYSSLLGDISSSFMFLKQNSDSLAASIHEVLVRQAKEPEKLYSEINLLKAKLQRDHDVSTQMERIVNILEVISRKR